MSGGSAVGPPGSVREFTRHAGDVLLNLDHLRHRHLLTDVTLLVGGRPLLAHKAVLAACSGFFYSIFLGRGGRELSVLALPSSIQPAGFQALLDFMYTSRLPLSPASAPTLLRTAAYLQMEHVVETCDRFLQASSDHISCPPKPLPSVGDPEFLAPPSSPPAVGQSPGSPSPTAAEAGGAPPGVEQRPPDSPSRSEGHPASPQESSGCTPAPRACHWKKYKVLALHAQQGAVPLPPKLLAQPPIKGAQGGREDGGSPGSRPGGLHPTWPQHPPCPPSQEPGTPLRPACPQLPQPWPQPATGAGPFGCGACQLALGAEEEEEDGGEGGVSRGQAPAGVPHDHKPFKCQLCRSTFRYKGNLASHRAVHTGEKPYRCGVCGAQFNRPANLKTHSRIHSGEKPYKCETCGSSFVQVAHLRAHVLIHTGEKPYPCETCGTRFRHLQTLKSHIRIHTGEKPYHCEACRLRFRHKSQLRLHLRQKHGAITNTKVRYAVLAGPCAAPR
ncbi:B-cell CLL/lymphoma 6 member B protein isoform X1 [Carettochelys insculpta]|uniref:B-cell CLL/lymphoma 6 member B protein isoform X1 n=1 Tax=Carettochelys insculpta TaxID=44489 RepID=UPI003EBE4693